MGMNIQKIPIPIYIYPPKTEDTRFCSPGHGAFRPGRSFWVQAPGPAETLVDRADRAQAAAQ